MGPRFPESSAVASGPPPKPPTDACTVPNPTFSHYSLGISFLRYMRKCAHSVNMCSCLSFHNITSIPRPQNGASAVLRLPVPSADPSPTSHQFSGDTSHLRTPYTGVLRQVPLCCLPSPHPPLPTDSSISTRVPRKPLQARCHSTCSPGNWLCPRGNLINPHGN